MTMQLIAPTLIALALCATIAHAEDLPDDTPVRGITIAPENSPMGDDRLIFSEVVSMKECREALPQMLNGLTAADEGIMFLCLPVDLVDLPKGATYPIVQYTVP